VLSNVRRLNNHLAPIACLVQPLQYPLHINSTGQKGVVVPSTSIAMQVNVEKTLETELADVFENGPFRVDFSCLVLGDERVTNVKGCPR